MLNLDVACSFFILYGLAHLCQMSSVCSITLALSAVFVHVCCRRLPREASPERESRGVRQEPGEDL